MGRSNERLLWLQYSGFQESCHNTNVEGYRHVNLFSYTFSNLVGFEVLTPVVTKS
jgi:hypothetical protein